MTILNMTYVHNLDPFALQLTETFGIRWYGLAYLAGFVVCYFSIVYMIRKGRCLLTEVQLADFITYGAIGVLGGGRLGYCLFYSPDLLTSVDGHFPYWGVLKVNEGGMASHGGIIGVMLVCLWYARKHKLPFLHIMDLTVIGASLAFFFGRIANFINGELYGREAPATLAWAVKFPSEMFLWLQRDFNRLHTIAPVVDQMKSVPATNGSFEVTGSLWKTWLDNYGPDPVARGRVAEVIENLIHRIQYGDDSIRQALAPFLTPRHPSQLYQCFLEGFMVFLILAWIWRKPQKPGVVSGWFGVLYCIARIIGEEYRLPDAHIGFQWLGLTRGQWLSIGFVMFAVGYLANAYRRNVNKI